MQQTLFQKSNPKQAYRHSIFYLLFYYSAEFDVAQVWSRSGFSA